MLTEFRAFLIKTNALALAIGVIIGIALGAVVNSLVNDIIMPPIGLVIGGVDFNDLFIDLSGRHSATLADAKAHGAATINIGMFLNATLDFVIVAFSVFLFIRQVNRFVRAPIVPSEKPPAARECPYCLSMIPARATRCAHCTSNLPAAA